jgi:hypothetical protein
MALVLFNDEIERADDAQWMKNFIKALYKSSRDFWDDCKSKSLAHFIFFYTVTINKKLSNRKNTVFYISSLILSVPFMLN